MVDRHADIERLIDDYVDGSLDDLRARAVRGHLRTCADCSAKVAATESLIEISGSLPALEAPDTLWARISENLDEHEDQLASRGRWFWLLHSLGRRLAYGGGALAVAGLVVAIGVLHHFRNKPLAPALEAVRLSPSPEAMFQEALLEVERADADYRTAIGDLRGLAQSERTRWAPEVRTAFDQNLAVIDAAVARQADLARRNPGDVMVADALAESYRKEIDFLQSAVVRGELN